jgi:hypothetical protein
VREAEAFLRFLPCHVYPSAVSLSPLLCASPSPRHVSASAVCLFYLFMLCVVCRVVVPSSVLCPLVLLGALGLGPRGQRLLQTSRRTAQLAQHQNKAYTHGSEMQGLT